MVLTKRHLNRGAADGFANGFQRPRPLNGDTDSRIDIGIDTGPVVVAAAITVAGSRRGTGLVGPLSPAAVLVPAVLRGPNVTASAAAPDIAPTTASSVRAPAIALSKQNMTS